MAMPWLVLLSQHQRERKKQAENRQGLRETAHEPPVLVMVETEQTLMEDIEVLDHRQIVFKRGQENPVKPVQKELAVRRPEMMLENGLKSHSAANDIVGKQVIGLTRVQKDAQQANIKQAMEPNIPVMTFTVKHAATIISSCSVGPRWRRHAGRPQTVEMAEFGERRYCSSP